MSPVKHGAEPYRRGRGEPLRGSRRVLGAGDIQRALSRIAHEIIEANRGTADLVIMGIPTRGVHLARRLASRLDQIEHTTVPTGVLDVQMFRDDRSGRVLSSAFETVLPQGGVNDKVIILVDDVLFSGRTSRAALDALSDLGRPRAVRLAVMVDRGHRELPIRADHVGKNLPTASSERVHVLLDEVDGEDGVFIASSKTT